MEVCDPSVKLKDKSGVAAVEKHIDAVTRAARKRDKGVKLASIAFNVKSDDFSGTPRVVYTFAYPEAANKRGNLVAILTTDHVGFNHRKDVAHAAAGAPKCSFDKALAHAHDGGMSKDEEITVNFDAKDGKQRWTFAQMRPAFLAVVVDEDCNKLM